MTRSRRPFGDLQRGASARACGRVPRPRPPSYVLCARRSSCSTSSGLVMILSASSVAALSNYGSSWYFFNRQLGLGAARRDRVRRSASRVDYHVLAPCRAVRARRHGRAARRRADPGCRDHGRRISSLARRRPVAHAAERAGEDCAAAVLRGGPDAAAPTRSPTGARGARAHRLGGLCLLVMHRARPRLDRWCSGSSRRRCCSSRAPGRSTWPR